APSAVVDGSFNVHLTYVDSSGAVKYRQRTSSWGAATTLDAAGGNTYATISRDTGTGDLYVFYVSTSNQIKAQKYSGSWSAVVLETNTKSKSSLTSSYDAASSSNIAWAWGQGTVSPYDVKISVLSTSLYSRTIDTSTDANANPVSYNHQRKIFHDGAGYFWAFYFDGSNTFTTMSPDAMTWELNVWQMFTTSAIDNPSVWFHDTGTSRIVYLVGDDTTTNDHQLTVHRCTISGTTPTCGSDTAVTFTGQGNMAGMIAFITKDTNGRLWIIANDSPSVSNYNVGVVRSTNADDVSSWGSVTNLMSASISTNNIFPTVLPQSGGDMYAVWYANGNIQGRKYTASNTTWWNTVETIASTTSGVTTKIPSATVDSSDNVDIVYIDSSGAVIHKQRASSWGSADTVDAGSGNTSPTITRESSTGDLYVFYLQTTGQVKGRKLHSGSWSDMTTGVDTNTITKAFITSPYTVDAAWKVAWEWDQGTTSPYEIKVAHIPEFGDLLPPIAMTIVIVLSIRGRRRSRGPRGEAAK
ncbi:MAG TPA: hypothetical protein VEM95_07765, partial [Thermoplasmata archaeon]|nr:hypothetical protein [Thermoplasmata archaeon]